MTTPPTAEEMEMSGEFDDYQSMARTCARNHLKAAYEKISKDLGIAVETLEIIYPYKNVG
jgi:hypothetical protein